MRLTLPYPDRSQRSFLHILDDDSLLNIFGLCRPAILDEDEADEDRILQGGKWGRERWWYKLAHTCRRWRYLLFASASYLGLSLVCSYGTQLAAILAHSPPIPLIIDHIGNRITAKDQDRIILALQHRDRVRRIRLKMPLSGLYRISSAFDQEFPILDYLYIEAITEENPTLILPITFQAPRLRHLILIKIGLPVRSPLLIDAMGAVTRLVTLSLQDIRSMTGYFHPGDLLQGLSFMPFLETLGVTFHPDTQGILLNTSIATSVTLPNLRWFSFGGASAYLQALLPQMTVPHLEKLQLRFLNQWTSVPCLLKFMKTLDNVKLGSAKFRFYKNAVDVEVYPYRGATMYAFSLVIDCTPLSQQVASTARIFSALRTVFSTVDHLTLEFLRYPIWYHADNYVDRVRWRELLRSFGNVKTLYVDDDFLGQISNSLCVRFGESSMDPLPQLKELEYSAKGAKQHAFNPFIDARKGTHYPVSLVCRGSYPTRGQLVSRDT